VHSLGFLCSLPDASGKSLLRQLGFGYMLSPMVAYTSRIIMQAIPARVIIPRAVDFLFDVLPSYHQEQIPDARGSQDPPGDSPVRISYTPGMAEERMLGSWGSHSMNDMDSHSPRGILGIPIGMSHWQHLLVRG